MKIQMLLLLLVMLTCCHPKDEHIGPTHNFTVQRILILNDKNELLMCREESVWATPSMLFNERQFLSEGLDSLANAYGIDITAPKLRGHFGFKYDYHPYATLRSYFVARYIGGDLKVPDGLDDARWVPISEAIEKNTVTAIKQITEQIITNPDVVWGGSFMVSHVGDDHPTRMVEPFYPLFECGG